MFAGYFSRPIHWPYSDLLDSLTLLPSGPDASPSDAWPVVTSELTAVHYVEHITMVTSLLSSEISDFTQTICGECDRYPTLSRVPIDSMHR